MKRMRVLCVAVFVLVATVVFPSGANNFIADDATLRQATIYDQGDFITVRTGSVTVADFLNEAGVELAGFDRVDHALSSPIWDGIVINVARGIGFYVQVDNGIAIERASRPETTVAQVLTQLQQEKNISLLYSGNGERQISEGDLVNFQTWTTRFESEITDIPYETIENFTRNVWTGQSHIRQVGSPGEHEVVTAVVYVGGVESHRGTVESVILVEPVTHIIDRGTAPMGARADVTAPDFHYVRRLRMEATAYTSGFGCTGKHPCDPWYGITASGRRVEHGIVAVDRNLIPLGTRLYVEGHGFALAADVGSAIRGHSIDLFMYDLQDALRFGRRHLYVWILE